MEAFNTEIFAVLTFIRDAFVVPRMVVEVIVDPNCNLPEVNSLPIFISLDGIVGSIAFVFKLSIFKLVVVILSEFKFTISMFPNNSILSANNFIKPVVPEPIWTPPTTN